MKKPDTKIKGTVKTPKPRIGVIYTRVELSDKDKRRVQLKDMDKMLRDEDKS